MRTPLHQKRHTAHRYTQTALTAHTATLKHDTLRTAIHSRDMWLRRFF